ncbi:uncharacterized protein NPIL_105661 [Nephila pilipes]|uniref:THAP-type domain-containing protein n=1 Tax=Nephila pilipes TaxID=299642 RepID=A0A8X6I374_NEPPI|nr:uncharacterized protein NPIL_105661 [Nephila pilipes]
MPRFCAAFSCTNSSWKESCQNKNISFHSFPLSNKILLQKWLLNVRRANFYPTRSTPLCSEHFTEDDFEYQPFTNRRTLKRGAVPTKFSYEPRKRTRRKKNKHLDKEKVLESIEEKERFYLKNNEAESSESEFIHSDSDSSDPKEDDATLLDVSMNEKFYHPEQVKSLANCSKRKDELDKKIHAMKEKLATNIVLRTLKKQFLDAQIKAANAKRDYYSTKKSTLSKIHNVELMNDCSDLEKKSKVLRNIKVRIKNEEFAAKIEEKMLQQQLAEAEMTATHFEKEYHKAKLKMFSDSDEN